METFSYNCTQILYRGFFQIPVFEGYYLVCPALCTLYLVQKTFVAQKKMEDFVRWGRNAGRHGTVKSGIPYMYISTFPGIKMRVYCFKTWQIKNWYLRVYVFLRTGTPAEIHQKKKNLPRKRPAPPTRGPALGSAGVGRGARRSSAAAIRAADP